MVNEVSEALTFGLERELTYAGHLTPAAQLVPLVKRTFASADETHVRVWGPAGDIAKFPFPSNRRSMVSALTFCPSFSTIVTGEVDMTLKCYSLSLELVECFPLEQARSELRGDGRGERKASGKVTSLASLPGAGSFILAGSECGCELWQLTKSRDRRINTSRLRGLEYHLQLNLIKQVTTEPVHRVVVAAEQRVVIAGLKTVLVLDHELNLMASCNQPFVCSAYLHMVSSSQAQLLTGTGSGAVQLWNIQAFEAKVGDPSADGLCTRLEHTFYGHTRSVEMVCFYDRDERDVQQRFAVSCALDLRLQVWSLENFVCVYTLYFGLTDSKAHIFPISLHHFALSYTVGGGSNGDGAKGASVALMRFNAHYASPFATTGGTVVQIAQAPAFQLQDAPKSLEQPPTPDPPKKGTNPAGPHLAGAAVLVSEDMAIRVFSTTSRALLSTLPPPPNAKVQVLEVFLCPEWQLLILWLSSEEVAIFYVPAAPLEKKSKTEGQRVPRTQAATPLLLRRFSIVEVRTQMMDKDLSKESFRCVSLYHGPLPKGDTLLHTVKVAQQVLEEDSSPASPSRYIPKQTPPTGRDWYLLVGTQMGTLQAFKIADLLMELPVWGRIAPHLPNKEMKRRSRAKTMRTQVLKTKEADGRLAEIEKEHEAALEESRTPGQRPFPPSGPQLKLYSRWRRHDYAIEFVKSVADLILTIDTKNGLKVCQAEDSRILFRLLLPEFSCLTPYLAPPEPAQEANLEQGEEQVHFQRPEDPSQLLGVTLGNSRGALETVEFPWSSPDVEVFSSQASHGGPVLQVDYLLPIEIFVSVGKDDTVRFWSSALHLLREVFFPQPCSTVAFLRLPDMDSSAGHGDVLVGFAAHVERVPMEVWARGVKHEKLGTHPLDSTMRSSQGSKASGFTKSTTLEEDELLLQELYTFSPEDEDVLGERPPSTEIVKVVDEEVAPRKRRTGAVMDFRGAPVMPLGILGGLAADMVGVEERLAHRPEALEHVPHEHSQVLDQGDFRAITRYHAGYYDWTVNPSAMVDAPRGCAIRGVTGDGNVAIVTSVGVGHLRGEGHSFERPAEAQEACRDELPAQASLEEIGEDPSGELLDEAQMAQGSPSPRPPTSASAATSASVTGATTIRRLDTRQQLRTESRTSARTGEVRGPIEECVEETDDEGAVIEEEEEVEDTWRNLRIARGVPHRADVPKPQTQNIANTDADAAKMLRERGKLIDAPEGIETNFLSRITNKKTEWIYCGVDNVQVARRTARKMVHQTIDEGEGLKLWTATGRLRTGHRAPPQRALPKCYVPLPPEHLWERPPMTRSEVTERRIIEAARSPQSGHWMQELALESAEFGQVQRPLIASARVRPRGGQSSRSPSSVTVTSAAETDTSSSVGRPGLPRKVSFNLPQVPKTQR